MTPEARLQVVASLYETAEGGSLLAKRFASN
jgi:hypothetical protein